MDDDAQVRLASEVAWCLEQMRERMSSGRLSERQMRDMVKAVATLESRKVGRARVQRWLLWQLELKIVSFDSERL